MNVAPVAAAALLFDSVIVNTLELPAKPGLGLNALATVGALTTDRVAEVAAVLLPEFVVVKAPTGRVLT